jgi:hypothetical protein
MALGSAQPLTEMSTRGIHGWGWGWGGGGGGVKGRPARKADNPTVI